MLFRLFDDARGLCGDSWIFVTEHASFIDVQLVGAVLRESQAQGCLSHHGR